MLPWIQEPLHSASMDISTLISERRNAVIIKAESFKQQISQLSTQIEVLKLEKVSLEAK